jgi:hypothetical protein
VKKSTSFESGCSGNERTRDCRTFSELRDSSCRAMPKFGRVVFFVLMNYTEGEKAENSVLDFRRKSVPSCHEGWSGIYVGCEALRLGIKTLGWERVRNVFLAVGRECLPAKWWCSFGSQKFHAMATHETEQNKNIDLFIGEIQSYLTKICENASPTLIKSTTCSRTPRRPIRAKKR